MLWLLKKTNNFLAWLALGVVLFLFFLGRKKKEPTHVKDTLDDIEENKSKTKQAVEQVEEKKKQLDEEASKKFNDAIEDVEDIPPTKRPEELTKVLKEFGDALQD